jgi:hypothetical protein
MLAWFKKNCIALWVFNFFFFSNYIVSSLTLSFLIHFELIFVNDEKNGSIFIRLYMQCKHNFFLAIPGLELRAWHLRGKCSILEPCPSPFCFS